MARSASCAPDAGASMTHFTTTVTRDENAKCWRFSLTGQIDQNTRVRVAGARLTKAEAQSALNALAASLPNSACIQTVDAAQ